MRIMAYTNNDVWSANMHTSFPLKLLDLRIIILAFVQEYGITTSHGNWHGKTAGKPLDFEDFWGTVSEFRTNNIGPDMWNYLYTIHFDSFLLWDNVLKPFDCCFKRNVNPFIFCIHKLSHLLNFSSPKPFGRKLCPTEAAHRAKYSTAQSSSAAWRSVLSGSACVAL